MVIDSGPDLYEGVFYCAKCYLPKHVFRVLVLNESCDGCGGVGFISLKDFDVMEIIKEVMEKWQS